MIIKDKNYYENFNRYIEYLHKSVEYHVVQANNWIDIYRVTKDKRGCGWLNKFAKRMNNRHVRKGIKIAMGALRICNEEIVCLEKYISNID